MSLFLRQRAKGHIDMKALNEESGQALLELSGAFVILVVFALGIIDFGQTVYDAEVMKNIGGQTSSLASRGTNPATTIASAVANAPSVVSLGTHGCVIETVVTNNNGTLQVTNQASQCAISVASKIGCVQGQSGCNSSTPVLPAAATSALQSEVSGSSLYITEIFYNYTATTPINQFLQGTGLPSQLYSVTYY